MGIYPPLKLGHLLRRHVRFGSLADMCSATADVRFTLNSDRESGFPQKAMSALPPKADMCTATRDVRFVPIADIALNTGRLGTMPFGFWLTERMLSLVTWKTRSKRWRHRWPNNKSASTTAPPMNG